MKRIFTILAAVSVLSACVKESDDIIRPEDSDLIRFEMGVPQTKVASGAFETGDCVAMFAVEYDAEQVVADENYAPELQIAGNFLNNEKVVYDGSKWAGERTLYWSDAACDFYALYPYQKLTSVDEHYFEIAADQNSVQDGGTLGGYEASDLMFAKASAVSREDDVVKMQFRHIMSRCIVRIVKGADFEGELPDDITAHIYNTITSAKLDFAAGSVEKDGLGNRKTITMKKISNERFEAVVVPQNIERRTPLIEVTMGGIAYLLEYSLSFKPGYEHVITLIVNTSPDQENLEISIDASVDDMEE